MPSEKAAMILQSKTDLSREEIGDLSEAEAWARIYSIRSIKAKDKRLQICFTGFGETKKAKLADIALGKKLKVVASVTKKLDFLCCGETPGPKKLEDAIINGAQRVTEKEFIDMIETGVVPF